MQVGNLVVGLNLASRVNSTKDVFVKLSALVNFAKNTMQGLGEILKMSRESHDMTLRDVEEAVGVSNAYLSQLENGKIKKPSANVLYKLSNLYGVTLENLLEASGIINKEGIKNTVVAAVLGPYNITPQEEIELTEYLRWLRFKDK